MQHQQQEGFALAGEMPLASSSLQEDAISWLISAGNANGTSSGSSYVTASKGWAGASHWRYRAVPQSKDNTGEDADENDTEFGQIAKKRTGTGSRKRNEPLDFVALMADGAEEPTFELLPRGKSGRRRTTKTTAKTLLPEDYHYTSEFLGRYALRPRTAVAIVTNNNNNNGGTIGGDFTSDGLNDFGNDDFGEDGNGGDAYGGEWDGGAFASGDLNVGDDVDIAHAAHRVEKVEVNYSRAAKQVDVRYLKELMWNGIQTVVAQHDGTKGSTPEEPIEFADILATVPENNPAGRIEDLSIHLCFICVLHLANEHGLVVRGVPELNKMQISNIVRVSV
jgi:condensin complex subunit 2